MTKITYQEAAARADLSKCDEFVYFEELYRELEIFHFDYHCPALSRIKMLWVEPWYCTDTWVGTSWIVLDNEIVGYTFQQARKVEPNFAFFSDDAAKRVTAVLMEAVAPKGLSAFVVSPDGELGDALGYSLDYTDQVLSKTVVYNDEVCEVIRTPRGEWNAPLKLRRANGDVIEVHPNEVIIPYSNMLG